MEFEFINTKSEFLKEVMDLGKKNSSTLGFMPEGGFNDHAKKRHILIAKDGDVFIGYILFRIGLKTNKLSITHLCVSEAYRGQNISIKLLDQLKASYGGSLSGIYLSCREDYQAPNKVWENYGFVAKDKKRSRSQSEKYLIKWWYDFNSTDLFSFYEMSNTKRNALLDMNILIKLRDKGQNNVDQLQSLLADWLTDEVEFYYAPEFYNEINRDTDRNRSEKTRNFVAGNFIEAKFDKADAVIVKEELTQLIKSQSKNDLSDIKQLSECIASNIKYFITLDNYILSKRDIIQEKYAIEILKPEELILKIDELSDSDNYQPIRLSGAMHTTNKITQQNLNVYISRFLKSDKAETKSAFSNLVNKVIKDIKISNIKTVDCDTNGSIAFWGYQVLENSISIKFLRTLSNSLEFTLFTQLISEIINIAINMRKPLIEISDDFFCDDKVLLLIEAGFVNKGNIWVKVAIKDLIVSGDLINKYPIVSSVLDVTQIKALVSDQHSDQRKMNLYILERKFFPLKFSDLDLPCYIIPIKRYWAGQLFDRYNSGQDFFGAKPEKIWNRENVYYRNVKPVNEQYPARILWYVSAQKNQNRQRSILATSYLDAVTSDVVKEQFRKHKRFGIYEWDHIFDLAGKDINKKVKALKFSDTEVFEREVPFEKITKIFADNNRKKNTFVSPVQVSHEVFNDLYKTALQ